jgi:hypothetical protein
MGNPRILRQGLPSVKVSNGVAGRLIGPTGHASLNSRRRLMMAESKTTFVDDPTMIPMDENKSDKMTQYKPPKVYPKEPKIKKG